MTDDTLQKRSSLKSENILLHSGLPGIGEDSSTIIEKQGKVKRILDNIKTANIIHELTKIGGAGRLKNELKSVLAA
ncbi:MAG: hypothetical protein V2I97_03465 [Desulfococcaceae bacterium]|nr:hypothetical protein [Desulfococcaceae bacterium]